MSDLGVIQTARILLDQNSSLYSHLQILVFHIAFSPLIICAKCYYQLCCFLPPPPFNDPRVLSLLSW